MVRDIHLRLGPLLVTGYIERPSQSWKRVQGSLDVTVFGANG